MTVRDMLRTGDPMHMFSVFLLGIHPIALPMTTSILLVSCLLGLLLSLPHLRSFHHPPHLFLQFMHDFHLPHTYLTLGSCLARAGLARAVDIDVRWSGCL